MMVGVYLVLLACLQVHAQLLDFRCPFPLLVAVGAGNDLAVEDV
jgi:hypothetical protein